MLSHTHALARLIRVAILVCVPFLANHLLKNKRSQCLHLCDYVNINRETKSRIVIDKTPQRTTITWEWHQHSTKKKYIMARRSRYLHIDRHCFCQHTGQLRGGMLLPSTGAGQVPTELLMLFRFTALRGLHELDALGRLLHKVISGRRRVAEEEMP